MIFRIKNNKEPYCSEYMINSMTEWYETWKGNGFRNTQGRPLQNKEQIVFTHMQLSEFTAKFGIRLFFEYEKARDGNFGNIRADANARKVVSDFKRTGEELIHISLW